MNEQIINIDNIKQFTDQCFDKDNDKAAKIVSRSYIQVYIYCLNGKSASLVMS